MPQRASLKAFFQTGLLGPLAIGVSLNEVAETLGPPHYWDNFLQLPIPCFWGYRHLELRFSDRAPHRLVFFKLHDAGNLQGRSVSLGSKLRLWLDGLNGAMKPSQFLASNLWHGREISVDIQLVAGELQLRLGLRPIEFLYVMSDGDVEDPEMLIAAFHRQDWRPLVAAFEKVSCLHHVGCYSTRDWRNRHWLAPLIATDGGAYLGYVGEVVSLQSGCQGSSSQCATV